MSRYIDIHTHHFTARHTELRAAGIHPWNVENSTIDESIFQDTQAIGEIGLDYACKVDRQLQEECFKQQLSIAQRLKLPVVIHCVKAFEQTLKILQSYTLRGVIFHGFIGSKELAAEVVKRGYFLSFGERTFRSPKTIEALRNTPLETLFLETDVSDVPIEDIYAMTAKVKGVDIDTLINLITNNYNRLFNI